MDTIEMLSINQAAKRTCLDRRFIRKLLEEKKVRFVKNGRKFLIYWPSLVNFLSSGQTD